MLTSSFDILYVLSLTEAQLELVMTTYDTYPL